MASSFITSDEIPLVSGHSLSSLARSTRYNGSMGNVVTRNPEILGGEPVFAGTRVPIKSLFEHLEAGDSIADFLEGFPSVKRDQVLRSPRGI
jgi:uncharacterized protein (DUF433 family)